MKIMRVISTLLFLIACQAQAELIVIGDVDAPNTNSRPQNYPLLENVRNGGTDILWLTGGFSVNNRYTDLRARWAGEGATITDDLTTNVGTSLAGRDLVVVSQLWCEDSMFETGAINAIAAYLAGGGEVLYIAQICSPEQLASYNEFLTAIGSTMQFIPDTGDGSGTGVINTGTPYGQGVTEFYLSGWDALSGGIAVVTFNDEIAVAYGTAGRANKPVPALSGPALLLMIMAMLAVGGYGFARSRRTGIA